MTGTWRILTHGGAGSEPDHEDGTDAAAEHGLRALRKGASPLDAACQAVAHLEDDERFNAGTGSNLRRDGQTVQMDAACSASDDRFGAVACIEAVRHPIEVARGVVETEHLVLAGTGATAFARQQGVPEHDPVTERARERALEPDASEQHEDTVGAVTTDGETFAAALSSGGTRNAMLGRVGDVPLPGCGLRAGRSGAVAATGNGEAIARRRTADRAHRLLSDGNPPDVVVEEILAGFPDEHSIGLIVLGRESSAAGSNRSMAWSRLP